MPAEQPQQRIERHRRAHAAVTKLAWVMDNSITIPIINKRIGLDAVVGLVPFIGDLIGAIISLGLIIYGALLGMPKAKLLKMSGNMGIELLVGLVPFLGDVFDAIWKSNTRNAQLFEEYLVETIAPEPPKPAWQIWLKRGLILATVVLICGGVMYSAWLLLQAVL